MPNTKKKISFDEISYFLKKSHRIDIYDVSKSHKHFDTWCEKRKYGQKDPMGIYRESSQIWFSEYMLAEDGYKMSPEYHNFWRYIYHTYNFEKKCKTTSSRHKMTIRLDTNTQNVLWVDNILQKIAKKYGPNPSVSLDMDR